LDEAIKLAKATGAILRLFHVFDAATFFRGIAGAFSGDVTQLLKASGKNILENGQALVEASNVKVDSVLLDSAGGRVSDCVVEQARVWGADLIVIGTHGRRGVGRWQLGIDAQQIMHAALAPVLLVRAKDAERQSEPIEKISRGGQKRTHESSAIPMNSVSRSDSQRNCADPTRIAAQDVARNAANIITFALTDEQAQAMAEFLQRQTWSDVRQNTISDEHAYLVMGALNSVQYAIAGTGYSPG
jgi:nucleotide-binding universal stress UspA family protein